nr:GAF domain-containing protein [Stenotrophomonas maltophilia]
MDEAERLLEIERLHLLDTPPEPVFDAIVAAARAATGLTMGLITVVAEDRQWFKANIGLEGVSETAREISFCTHAIRQDELFEIPDARQDPRFSTNPLVTGGPRIRHYAGIPLGSTHGARIGTLCLLEPMPGVLSPSQRELMVHLARVTTQVLEQRSTLMAQVGQAKALHRELKRSEDFLERTNRAARVGGWEMDLLTNEVRWTRETKQLHGVRSNFTPTLETALSFYREDSRNIIQAAVQRCIDEGTSWGSTAADDHGRRARDLDPGGRQPATGRRPSAPGRGDPGHHGRTSRAGRAGSERNPLPSAVPLQPGPDLHPHAGRHIDLGEFGGGAVTRLRGKPDDRAQPV